MVLYPMLGIILVLAPVLPVDFRPITGPTFGGLAVLAALGFTAMLALVEGFKRAEAALLAPMQYSQLIWGILFGLLFFDEWPEGPTLIGAVLIIGSGLYIVLREARLHGPADQPPPPRPPLP